MAAVFHIATAAEWQAADLDGDGYAPAGFAAEGFVHCSTRHQVLATLDRHFPDPPPLLLVALREDLGPDLRFEHAPSVGEDFPHLHRRIHGSDVLQVAPLHRAPDGSWRFPSTLEHLT